MDKFFVVVTAAGMYRMNRETGETCKLEGNAWVKVSEAAA